MNKVSRFVLPLVVVLATAACGPAGAPGAQGTDGRPAVSAPQRTLAIIARGELPTLARKELVGYSGSLRPPLSLFNATLDFVDEKEVAHPYLAEALPELNTDTWRVFPDGRMETIHRLRPNLTWHDGAPLSAEDFIFAWRVYASPELGTAGTPPIRQIGEIVAPDARTVQIRWRALFAEAGSMDRRFTALPRHILEQPFQQLDAPAFVNHPFWTVEYVGLGPYRLTGWEPGAYMDAVAFDGHALGRPKIDRVRVLFIPDPSTALANMLTGDGHYLADFILGYDEGLALEQQWSGRNGGTVFFAPVLIRLSQVQQRPEHANPKALLDVRVRRALAHGFDTPGALEVFTGGRGVITHTLSSPRADYYPVVERVITKRDYDLRTTQRLLEEAGFRRGSDGFFVSASGEPLRLELWNTGGAVFERENRIFVDSLRQAGVDATPQTLQPARLRDAEFRALIGGMFTGGAGDDRLREYSKEEIPRPENRWQGNNRGGWENVEYERLFQAFNGSLAQSERIQHTAGMERILNDDVGTIPHYFTVVVTAHVSNLRGPSVRLTPDAPLSLYGGVHTWEWTS